MELPQSFTNPYICSWWLPIGDFATHYGDVIMGAIASQITSLTIVYSTVYSGADQRKHQSPASLAFVWGIHRRPVNSPHKWPVTRKMFPFVDVIMFFKKRLAHSSKTFLLPLRGTSNWSRKYPNGIKGNQSALCSFCLRLHPKLNLHIPISQYKVIQFQEYFVV